MSEIIKIGQAAQIPLQELLKPDESDPYIDLTFVCEGEPSGKRCGKITMSLNLRTGHVYDQTPGEQVAFFWIDAGNHRLIKIIENPAIKQELRDLIIQGHGMLRHPSAEGVILEGGNQK